MGKTTRKWIFRAVVVIVGIATAIMPYAYPDIAIWKWRLLFWSCILLLTIFVGMLLYEYISKFEWAKPIIKKLEQFQRLFIITLIVSFVVGIIWIFAVSRNTVPLPQEEKPKEVVELKKPKTLYDYFKSDFQKFTKMPQSANLSKPDSSEVINVEYNLYSDSESNSKFISYYVPLFHDSSKTYEIILSLIDHHFTAFERKDRIMSIESYTPGDSSSTYSKDLKFSGIIYVYHAGKLLPEHSGEISGQYKNKGLTIILRDQDYALIRNLSKQKKESPAKQTIDKKNEIIKQLDQFARDGKILILEIEIAPSSEFPSKHHLPRIKKPSPVESKFAEWRNDVYIYLHNNVLAWAEIYNRLPRQVDVKSINQNRPRQEAYRTSMKAMVDSHIEKILEIIMSVNESNN